MMNNIDAILDAIVHGFYFFSILILALIILSIIFLSLRIIELIINLRIIQLIIKFIGKIKNIIKLIIKFIGKIKDIIKNRNTISLLFILYYCIKFIALFLFLYTFLTINNY
ncbi:MAG: hypothetical protein Q8831_00645 ['Bonamia sp.' little leaf phytoplasma]|nr:hypothetical protein ['Bonamia sp.' little leaf phytoplasma]